MICREFGVRVNKFGSFKKMFYLCEIKIEPMKKLTLVTVMCRGKIVSDFLFLPSVDGRPILPFDVVDRMFWETWGFMPQRGETISFL